MINYEFLKDEANKLGISLVDYAADRFDVYAERLVRWNNHVNLTAITEPDDIVIKHFVDCLNICRFVSFNKGDKVIDIGTGAGFPGMPLLIANPEIDMTFVDSIGKKLAFIKDVMRNNGLVGEIIKARAEELGKNGNHREQYDYATARAVAPMNVLCEYCLPLVKVGGRFIAMKGASVKQEVEEAEKAIAVLGGALEKLEEFELPNGDKRGIVIIKKISQTPTKYPRKSKKIDTKPL